MDGSTVFRGLVGIQERIQGPEFEAWRKNFVAEHVDKFSYEDENKLEYTEIHQRLPIFPHPSPYGVTLYFKIVWRLQKQHNNATSES
jgi:hypothetical protein